ncbi:MAG: DMP19 family protein [Chloroflexi bacterium]|nr:DMP19 family protein [Chloroflexota bacterium]
MEFEHIRIDDDVIDKGFFIDVLDPAWRTVDIYSGKIEYDKSLSAFTNEQRFLVAITWYISEVNNGGHKQFYYNPTGIVWKDALSGFQEIGLDEAVSILDESAKRIGGNPSFERETRWKQMDVHDPKFDDLDDRFYDLEERINLDEIMQDYIRKHRNAFYYEGDVKKSDFS